jgi:hypothetical protein
MPRRSVHDGPILTYLRTLRVQLKAHGLSKRQCAVVAGDVSIRLHSLLKHWNDATFRNTLLLIGTEEASFYEPRAASLDVRALVVVAVRNSLLEDVASKEPATAALRPGHRELSAAELRVITAAAVAHFQGVDLAALESDRFADLFDPLPARYPRAWEALYALANCPGHEVSYAAAEISPSTRSLLPDALPGGVEQKTVVVSGVDPTFDPVLVAALQNVRDGAQPWFVSTSFRGITRHTEKLFHVLDLVLFSGAAVVTPNYYLGPTYAARRSPLLRPDHRNERKQFHDLTGLSDRHREALVGIGRLMALG